MRTDPAEPRAGREDQARVDRCQFLCTDTVAVERARREVLEQDVGSTGETALALDWRTG